MLTQQQYQKLNSLGLSPAQVSQVVSAAGGYERPKSLAGFTGNVITSTAKLVGDTANALIHPIDTAKNIFNLGSGIIQLAIPGEQGNEKLARAVGNFYKNRYGSLDKAWNSFYSDPAGVAADLSTVLGVGAGTFKLLNAPKAAKALSTASKLSDPLNVASKIPSSVKSRINVIPKAGKFLESYGKELPVRGVGLPAQRQKLERGGVKISDLMREFPDLYSKDPEIAREVAKQIGEKYTKAGLRPDIAIDVNDITSRFDKRLSELKSLADRGSEVAGEELAQLTSIKESLIKDLSNNPSLEGVIKFKRDILQPNKPSGAFDPRSYSGKSKAYTTGYEIIKDVGIDANPELRQLGKQYRTAQGLPDIFERYQQRGKGSQLLRLPSAIGAGSGAAVGGVPGAVAGIVLPELINSPKGVETISRATETIGKKLQQPIKIPKGVSKASQIGYEAARTSRLLYPGEVSRAASQYQAPVYDEKRTPMVSQSKVQKIETPTSSNYTKLPKYNVFKNKSAFGKSPRLKKLGG